MNNETQVLNEHVINTTQKDIIKHYNANVEIYKKCYNEIKAIKDKKEKIAKLKIFQNKIESNLAKALKWYKSQNYVSILRLMDAKSNLHWFGAFMKQVAIGTVLPIGGLGMGGVWIQEKAHEKIGKEYSDKFIKLLQDYSRKLNKDLSSLKEDYLPYKEEIDLLVESFNWTPEMIRANYNATEKSYANAFRKAGNDLDMLYKLKDKFHSLYIDVENYQRTEKYNKALNKMKGSVVSIAAIADVTVTGVSNLVNSFNKNKGPVSNDIDSTSNNINKDIDRNKVAKDYTERFLHLISHYRDAVNEKIEKIKSNKVSEDYFDSQYDNILQEWFFNSTSKYSESEFLNDVKKAIDLIKKEGVALIKSESELTPDEKKGIDEIFIKINSNKTTRVMKPINGALIIYYITSDKMIDKPYCYLYKNKNGGLSFAHLNKYLKQVKK